ncbi:Sugar phosphate isomerase/epimerase [Spirosomataceae bacterium TFI 002]|nr:Sugar phosphate isomerase/epimerase [Spirosomataceae bacterium TFI 002]
MNRRNFVKNSLATAPLAFSKGLMENKPSHKVDVPVLVLATNWGFSWTVDEFCAKAKAEGYDGIEMWWQTDPVKQKAVFDALQKHEMQIGFLCGGNGPDFEKHQSAFQNAIKQASTNQTQKPLYINCHSGKDYFEFEQNSKLIEFTIDQTAKTGISVLHETHRSRMCFAAHVTRKFLDKYPKMGLTLDISHWTNVHESLLEDQEENVAKALERVGHIHARVGHQEGPQVNDPRAPEWEKTVARHFEWWDKALENQIKNGANRVTFLTEFGPPNYLPTLPFSNMPVANLWDINVHMLKTIKARYQ